MRYQTSDNSLYITNRKRLRPLLKPKSLVVLHSNDVMPTNADGHLKFRQNNDLFYLSGIDQEETVLLLFPDALQEKHREVLFVKKTSELIATWEGHKFSKDEASKLSGINTVYWTEQFDQVFGMLVMEAEYLYLNQNEHARNTSLVQTRDQRFIEIVKDKYPLHALQRVAPLLQELRMIKSELEIRQMKKAGDITAQAYDRLLKFVKPGLKEYEIEAEITHTFIKNGSRGHAYEPIIASGASACVLHYIDNDKECKDGDLLLLDFGAEYGNYNADLTRVIPVNGKFSQRQKEVYNAVLEVYNDARRFLRNGVSFVDYERRVIETMEQQLIKIGLLSDEAIKMQSAENPLYKKYFMHGVSHFLGLDVHDVGHKNSGIKAGMVLTIEPGIYIKEEGIGIRIENDVLITLEGNEELMPNIPTTVEEIENAMRN